MQAGAYPQIRAGATGTPRLYALPVSRFCFIPSNHASRLARPASAFFLPRSAVSRVFSASASIESTMPKPSCIVEHIVLLKVKQGVSSEQQDAMVSGLRSLQGMQTVIELSAGKAVQVWSETYTHALHCRFKSKEDLASYASDPFHLDVISKCIAPIVEDRLALDWEADLDEPVLGSASYGAVQIAALKPKEDLAVSELSDIMDMLKDYRSRFSLIKQVSVGKNFSPARAKGFEWAFMAFFPSPEELLELTKNEEHISLQYTKVCSAMEKIAVLDYYTA